MSDIQSFYFKLHDDSRPEQGKYLYFQMKEFKEIETGMFYEFTGDISKTYSNLTYIRLNNIDKTLEERITKALNHLLKLKGVTLTNKNTF